MRRAIQIAWELGGVLPRSVGALNGSGDWNGLSRNGLRQLGEVALDELVVTGMTLTGPPPQLPRPLTAYADAAAELGALGIAGAHRDPEPLHVESIERRTFGALRFEELSFAHTPALPESLLADGHGGVATARVRLYRRDEQRPWVVWIHGAGQGDPIDLMVARYAGWMRWVSTWRCRCSPDTARGGGPGRSIPRGTRWPTWPGRCGWYPRCGR